MKYQVAILMALASACAGLYAPFVVPSVSPTSSAEFALGAMAVAFAMHLLSRRKRRVKDERGRRQREA